MATTNRKVTARTSREDIRRMLREDGYGKLQPYASAIQAAARRGALLWTSERLTTTDASKLDARPEKG